MVTTVVDNNFYTQISYDFAEYLIGKRLLPVVFVYPKTYKKRSVKLTKRNFDECSLEYFKNKNSHFFFIKQKLEGLKVKSLVDTDVILNSRVKKFDWLNFE